MEESRKEIGGFYNKNYKRLLIIPVILFILAAVQIGAQYYKTGDFINKGSALTGSIAAFLMLIGYSVDTDILLSTKALKEKSGTLNERMFGAFKTGLVMSMTTITAVAVAYYFSQADILKQIMTVLFIGLNVDIINTWIQNTAILKWYIEKKER